MTIADALDAITPAREYDDLTQVLEELLEDPRPEEATPEAWEAAFRLFERCPLCDFGSPGPLVHWMEKSYPNYVSLLERSVLRRPTTHTLWMCNRILNGKVTKQLKRSLLTALESAAARTDVEAQTVEEAKNWLAEQRG